MKKNKIQKSVLKLLGFFLNITAPLFPKWNRELAFKLLCKVRRIPVSDHGQKFLEGAKISYIELPDSKIALHSWGNGPKTIFFVHGWMSYSYRWKVYIDNLDLSDYTIHSIDAPAHGFSEGDVLNVETYREAVAIALKKIGKVEVMICHSLGSLVGAYTFLENEKIEVNNYVIMGAPKNLLSLFDYFQDALGVTNTVITNLKKKAKEVLTLPMEEISMKNFFIKVNKPVLVIHETTDKVTPFQPIKDAVEINKENLTTFFTTGQNHNLKERETIYRILDFIEIQTQQETKKQEYVFEAI